MAWLKIGLGLFVLFGSVAKGMYNRHLGRKQYQAKVDERRAEEMKKDEEVDSRIIAPDDAYEWLRKRNRRK